MLHSRELISSLLRCSGHFHQQQVTRGLLSSSKKAINPDTLAWLQQPLDFSLKGILRWWQKKARQSLIAAHSFIPERHSTLGPDLATAHFVVARDGAIKFEGFDRWIKKNPVDGKHSLPSVPNFGIKLEAVDVSDTQMMYTSFDNFINLRHLKYLNVAGCANIDDWTIDRFFMFRDSLLVLDVSRCPNVTERGLATLHKLHRLKRLRMFDMPAVRHKQLTALLLEEVLPKGCIIEGVDYTDTQQDLAADSIDALPAFLKHYMEFACTMAHADVKKFDTAKQEIDDLVKEKQGTN